MCQSTCAAGPRTTCAAAEQGQSARDMVRDFLKGLVLRRINRNHEELMKQKDEATKLAELGL